MLKQQPGYRSYSAGVNRMTGRAFTVSTWDSPEHREASNAAIAHLREQVMQRSAIYGAEVALVETVVAEVRVPATA